MLSDSELFGLMVLSQLPRVGARRARMLLDKYKTPDNVLSPSRIVPECEVLGITVLSVDEAKKQADKELNFIKKHNICAYSWQCDQYPYRLKECPDAPLFFLVKGNGCLSSPKILSIVGTRKPSLYGKKMCESLVQELSEIGKDIIIVSGAAYGIDIIAHQTAIACGLETIAVLGHGLHTIYPKEHQSICRQIAKQGVLLTEYMTSTPFLPSNFVQRNRIIAGLADATVVIESGKRGGGLITAQMAFDYQREVFAFAGRATDRQSEGNNLLIRNNVAMLLSGAEDIIESLSWTSEEKISKEKQSLLSLQLSLSQENLIRIIKNAGEISVESLSKKAEVPTDNLLETLAELEALDVICSLPGGNCYAASA